MRHVIIFDIEDISSKFKKVSVAHRDCSLAPNVQIPVSCIGTVRLLDFKIEHVFCRGGGCHPGSWGQASLLKVALLNMTKNKWMQLTAGTQV